MYCMTCTNRLDKCRCTEGALDEAQAEIARLTAEVERTNDVLESQAHVIRDLRAKLDASWNDAIEAAAELANKSVNEGGMARSMAFFLDANSWSDYKRDVKSYASAIRALKRKPGDQQ